MKRRQILSGLLYSADAHSEQMGIIESTLALWRLYRRQISYSHFIKILTNQGITGIAPEMNVIGINLSDSEPVIQLFKLTLNFH